MSGVPDDPLINERRELRVLLAGYRHSQALYVAAKLNIPDLLADGAVDVVDIARLTSTDPDYLLIVLRALAGIGIVVEGPHRFFTLTTKGSLLRRDAVESLFPRASSIGEDWNWRAWGNLLESVRSGRPAFKQLFGKSPFDYFAENDGAGRTLHQRMAAEGRRRGRAIACAFDFGQWSVVADLGGGRGAVLAEILIRHPGTRGVLMDMPNALIGWENIFQQQGLSDRCRAEPGDFFENIPEGADVYILSAILHSWSDREVSAILTNVRQSIASDRKRLIIVEELIEGFMEPSTDLLFKDLQLLVNTSGKQRTEAELFQLIKDAGLCILSKSTVGPGEWLIEAAVTS
jgi:hypothetical protein